MMGVRSIIHIRSIIQHTRVNGPGDRLLLHLQGCEGMPCRFVCFNKDSHPKEPPERVTCVPEAPDFRILPSMDPADLAAVLVQLRKVSGSPLEFTISGGEPTQQRVPLLALLRGLRAKGGGTVVFTGYPAKLLTHHDDELLRASDAWVAGPYNPELPHNAGLRSSANQQVLLTTARYRVEDFEEPLGVEVHATRQGKVLVTGFPTEDQINQLKG